MDINNLEKNNDINFNHNYNSFLSLRSRHNTIWNVPFADKFDIIDLVDERHTTNHGEVSVQFLWNWPYNYMCS